MIMVGVVLISIEIHTYFVIKPTAVEFKDDIKMTSKYLPEILFCPRPAFNLKAMQQKGFKGWEYKLCYKVFTSSIELDKSPL